MCDVQNKTRLYRLSSSFTSSSWTCCPERQKYVNNHLFINAFKTFSEDCFGLCPDKSPFSLFSKPFFFGIMDRICPPTGKLCFFYQYCIFEISHNSRNQRLDAMAFCRASILDNTRDTKQREWSKWVAKVTLKWERNIKRLNGMTPKDVKVQVQILKYVFTLLPQRKINNKSIRNKKEYIFIYPSYVYLYINSSN